MDYPPASTQPLTTQQHAVNNDNNGNMMLHQEPQTPPQETPLDAAAQPIVEQEALNCQLEDVEVKDDNKDPDSDNNDKADNNNSVDQLDHRTEGKKTPKDELRGQVEELVEKLEGYEDIIKECKKIKDTEGRGRLSWPQQMVLLILEFLAKNGTALSAIPRIILSAYWRLYNKAPKSDVSSEDFYRKCRDVAGRFNETILLAPLDWKTMHTDELEGKE